MIVQHRLCCCTRILKENEGTPDESPRFGIGKPMIIVPRFYDIYRTSGAKIVATSGHLEVKNCTKMFAPGLRHRPLGELTALPQTPSWWGLAPLPETPLRLGPLGLGSLFALPWKKNSCYCLYYCIFERNKWRWRC